MPSDRNDPADVTFLLKHKERFSGEGPWSFAQSGGVIHSGSVPEEWTHWKNVYLWHPVPPWDREALDSGGAIASWPCQLDDWSPSDGDSWADYVGLYQRRPARKWRRLVEQIGYEEMWQADQFAEWLETNIDKIIETAKRDDDDRGDETYAVKP